MWRRPFANNLDISFARQFCSKPYIGVDMGTSNTRVAVMEGDTVRVLQNYRSAVYLPLKEEKCLVFVGTMAEHGLVTNPKNTFFGVKHLMGKMFDDPQVQKRMEMFPYKITRKSGFICVETDYGNEFCPSRISALILCRMKMTAEAYIEKSVPRAVITMPSNFDDRQIQGTLYAGRVAGIVHQKGINDAIAAAISYGLINKEVLFAVVDLGGGTFDVSILEVSNGHFLFKGPTKSEIFLGGEEFDNALVEYLVSEFKRIEAIDLRKDMIALSRVRKAAEEAKMKLSSASQTEISLPFIVSGTFGAKHLNITVTRSEFESLVNNLIERTKKLCRSCLKEAGVTAEDVDEVLLVGGMAKVPKLQKVVTEIFGKSPSTGVNPDEAVVVGAAASVHVGFFGQDVWRDD